MKNWIKKFGLAAVLALPGLCFAQAEAGHGGGNGGSDMEVLLKTRSLQISEFLNSTVGKQNFPQINFEHTQRIVEEIDFNVTTKPLVDRFGNVRTCLNFPDRRLVECSLEKVTKLIDSKKEDILLTLVFHEILGIQELELGFLENPSQYPISSKIIPYASYVMGLKVSENHLNHAFRGLDNKSLGMTFVNKKTKEELKVVCISDSTPVLQCRNFTIVKRFGDLQNPVSNFFRSFNQDHLKNIKFNEDETVELLNPNRLLSHVDRKKSVSNAKYEKILFDLKRWEVLVMERLTK